MEMETEMDQFSLVQSAKSINGFTHQILQSIGVSESWINFVNCIILIALVVVIVFILQKVTNKILIFILKKAGKITHLNLFKYAVQNKLPHFLGLVVPYSFVIAAIPIVFEKYGGWVSPLLKIADIYFVFMVIWTLMSLVKSFFNLLQEKPAFQNKPMQSYIQMIQIIMYIFGAVAIFSILTGKSATVFFTAMGAASAVLMLMFKDSIMGLVSSIQISTNQMVMIGDWITMNKYGADGTVEEINLTTVKVRNFDKTITTIPTYALISDSFQNWRGMQESGGRRIKRALYIKQSEIRTVTTEEFAKYSTMPALAEYIKTKQDAFMDLNKELKLHSGDLTSYGITNCDLYMQYIRWFLKTNPGIHQGMTLMVRQMAPTTEGLPIEIYAFTNTTVWLDYERIMGEIFSHVIAAISIFDIKIFESGAGSDGYNVYLKQVDKISSNNQNN